LNIIGVHECKMDNKGRVMIPSPLKKQLMPVVEDGFVLKRSVFQKCLELYPMAEWKQVMSRVNGLNRFVKKNNDFIRMFTAGVKSVELDGAGRLNISNDLIAFAGLKAGVVMSSAVSMIEIWDKDAYERLLNNPEVDFGALAEEVMGNNNPLGDGLS
jgi:MraZ protein